MADDTTGFCERATDALTAICHGDQQPTPPDWDTVISAVSDAPATAELSVAVYSPYTDTTFIESFGIEGHDDERVIGDPDNNRVFRLPGGGVGHFNTEFGTDRAPNRVVAFDIN